MDCTLTTTSEQVTLATLADKINAAHHAAEQALSAGLDHALRAGQLLTEAKARCDHGDWLLWLESHFEGSARTARAYMLVAQRWPQLEAKRQRAANLSLREALRITAEPKTTTNYSDRLDVDEDFLALIPELSADKMLYAVDEDDPSYLVELHPSPEHVGYFHLLVYRGLDTRVDEAVAADQELDGAYVDYDTRGCRYDRRFLAHVLRQCHQVRPTLWGSQAATGELPWPVETGAERMERVIREAHEKYGRN